MGRKTWDSLPPKYKPLPNRLNVVLTRSTATAISANDENGLIEIYSDLDQALYSLSSNPRVNEIFVIGGGTVYEQALKGFSEYCKLVILTRIGKVFEADTFMPNISSDDEGSVFTKIHIS
jgi:dihydrofolate reductase